ncbi:PAS domain-containing protein [Pseudanabaena yagii]|uniref:histidine kinase n=1 Tax=Pseudanabaena yagii GIHE-NHR1 TaxID=2722753 RepID=A0ABX1LS19_9CYAN|nr:PAS domain-containing protein [Pseudanabaena yagii]NMF57609.1 PAS domain-containing protein [Pseudanabaena yagii GIHE-NHR1]
MADHLNALIIDDSEDDTLLLLRELRHGGFQVSWERVDTEATLCAALDRQRWDVIISDYCLPKLDAPTAINIIQQRQSDVPFIVVSGMIGETLAVSLMRQGASDYLSKGNLARLSEVVRRELREANIRLERRKAERDLEQTKERLQLAIENSGIGLWDWWVETGAVSLDRRWVEMLGYTLDELQPISIETWRNNVHPEDLPLAEIVLDRHFRHEIEVYEVEFRMRHKIGGWVWVLARGKVVEWGETRQPIRMIGTHSDITGRKQNIEMLLQLNETLEERVRNRTAELKQSEMRLREAQQIAHLGSWGLDVQTREITWSAEIFRIFGLESDLPEPSYEEFLNHFVGHDRDRLIQFIDRAINEGEADEIDLQIRRDDGSLAYIFIKIEVIKNDANQICRLFGIAMDISDRKQAEIQQQQLFQELSAFKLALDQTAIVATTDAQGAITYANEYFCKISGYSHDELMGQNHRLLKSGYHPYSFFQNMWRTIARGEVWRGEVCNRHKNGSLYWVDTTVVPFINAQGRPFKYLAIRYDITAKKLTQARLQQENNFRQQIVESMAEGLCVCHEIEEYPFLHFTVWNRQMQTITGYTLDEINRLGWEQSLKPVSPQALCDNEDIVTTEHQLCNEEWEIYHKDGRKLIISMSRTTLLDEDGKSYLLALIQDISDRKQTELRLKQQVTQEHLLSAITQSMRSSLDLTEILNATVKEVHQVLECDRVLVYRVFAGGTGSAIAESVSPNWLKVLDIVFPEEVFPEQNYERYVQGRIYTLSDSEDPDQFVLPCFVEFLKEIQARAKLVVPIVQNQKLWGLLIAHQCDRPRQWQIWEIDLLKQVSSQLAIAIQQSDLYSQLQVELKERQQINKVVQQQAERESLLREITQRIRQSLNLQTTFETAVQEIQQFLNADRVGIFKFYPDSNFDDGEFVAEFVLPGFNSAIAAKIHDHCFGQKYSASYAQGRIQAVHDIYNAGLQDCHVQVLAQFQIRANLVVPLLNAKGLWGLLCIHQCSSPRVWQDVEIDLVKQIANQLAIAIQQVSLFEQLQQELTVRQQAETKLTEINQKLAISNEDLVRATRLKDDFLANMSHELRTPLNAILGMTEGMRDGVFGAVSDRQMKALQTVESSGIHLLALINDILDVAKIESGKVTLELNNISIENLCQSSMTFINQQASAKNIKLIARIPPHLPELMLDERRIRQVLINLLNNAVKFTPEGGTITLSVSHSPESVALESANYLRITVMDTGIGISAENMQKLFQPFIQIDSALNRQYVGTGLGLALVKRIVELHGGKVSLTSELGVGSCFMIDLPYQASATYALANLPPSSNPEFSLSTYNSSKAAPPLILIADDNEANISTLSAYLEAKGYRLLLAKNGQEAIAIAKEHRPDLILMDIQMPVIDGLEATRQIRLDPNLVNVPIIAITALAMTGDREQCLAAGANEYITKPVKLKQLASDIQQLLPKRT